MTWESTTSRAAGPDPIPGISAFSIWPSGSDFKTARITAFGSTRRPGIHAADDANLKALLNSGTPAAAIFGKSWDLHVQSIMDNTLEENLAMIAESVAFLKASGREVIYDAEHFFDGYKDDPDYALETLAAAVERRRRFPGPVRHQRRHPAPGD